MIITLAQMNEALQLAIDNKDVFTTLILFIVVVPLVWFLLKNLLDTIKESNNKIIEGINNLNNSLEKKTQAQLITQEAILEKLSRNSELYNERFDKIEQYATKLNLSNEDILEIASAKVWLTSEKKLDFIKQRLEKNNLTSRRDIIERQIEVELKRRSEEYLVYLDRFSSSVGSIGKYIRNNFPMEDFLKEVYDVVFRTPENKDRDAILIKINDIRFLMMAYQRELWEKLRVDLYNNQK